MLIPGLAQLRQLAIDGGVGRARVLARHEIDRSDEPIELSDVPAEQHEVYVTKTVSQAF